MTPSSAKKAVLAKIVQPHPLPDIPESSRLTVHAAVSRFSVLYEKIRNAVDYREDHLLRKAAIVRIVKRQLALDGDPRSMGQQLVRELIAARYGLRGPGISLSEYARRAGISRTEARLRESRAMHGVLSAQEVIHAVVTALEFEKLVGAA